MLILVINCGSTSTKLAIFKDETELVRKTLTHSSDYLKQFGRATDQADFRFDSVKRFLEDEGYAFTQFDCVVARGGILPPLRSGAYIVDDAMMDLLFYHPIRNAHSNLSGILAYQISKKYGVPAYIYDGVTTDELSPIARYSGVAGSDRYSHHHALNTRAMAKEAAEELGIPYDEGTFIVAHMGGGFSVNVHCKGRMTDVITAEEGAFSTERCGGLAGDSILNLVEEHGIDHVRRLLHGQGGLVSYFGTNNVTELLERVAAGDKVVENVLRAMVYQTAKSIGALSTTVNGRVDAIILTGGLANSARLMDWLAERVGFIAPIVVKPGEHEMEALARGALRVMRGEENAHSIG